MHDSVTRPVRKKLSHEMPSWVSDGGRYFITVNCYERHLNQLCCDGRAEGLLKSIAVYESIGKWWIHLMVIMPDHVHFIATFTRQHGIQSVITTWKGYYARLLDIRWQTGYFEHRLRNDAEFTEKAQYVRLNPVRKQLVSDWRDWPYLFQRAPPPYSKMIT
jgi:putative transposase